MGGGFFTFCRWGSSHRSWPPVCNVISTSSCVLDTSIAMDSDREEIWGLGKTKEMRRTWKTFKAKWPDRSSLLSRSHYTLQEEFLSTSLLKMPRSYLATLLGYLTLICVLDLITGSWIRLSSEGRTSEAKGRVSEVRKIETLSTGTVVFCDLSRHGWTQDRLSSTSSICITSCLTSHQRPAFPRKGHLRYNVSKRSWNKM